MNTKTKKLITAPVIMADDLALAYLKVQEAEKELIERKAEIKEHVLRIMGKRSVLETEHGTFRLESRESLSWSLEAVKGFFGPKWTAFIKADDKLVKAKMETMPELKKLADVRVVEALTLR